MTTDELFEQAKNDGFVNVNQNTDEALLERIKRYNEEMGECRVNRGRMKKYERMFLAVNPICSLAFYLLGMLGGKNIALISILIVVFLVVYFIFTMAKRNYYVVSIAAAVLLLVHPLNALLMVGDLYLAISCVNIDSELKRHSGYIAFNDIRLIYNAENSAKSK